MNPTAHPPHEAVHRALRLLQELRSRQSMSVSEAADLLDVAPSTAHRLLTALCYDNFAIQGQDRLYRAGVEALNGLFGGYSTDALRRFARPEIEELSTLTDETVQLWIRQGSRVRFVDGVEGSQSLSVRSNTWDDSPAITSAAGRVMLSSLDSIELRRIHGDEEPDWGNSQVTTYPELEDLLRSVRKAGYALSIEENVAGVNGVAAAVKDSHDQIIAAVSIAVPTVRFSRKRVQYYVAALKTSATKISENLTAE